MTEEVKDDEGNVTEEPKLISTVKQSMEVEYTEDGIRLAHDNLSKEKSFMDKRLIDLEEQFEGEMPEDLKKLKDQLQAIGKYDASEKARTEHKAIQERLKIVNAEIKSLTDEIGTRLKF